MKRKATATEELAASSTLIENEKNKIKKIFLKKWNEFF